MNETSYSRPRDSIDSTSDDSVALNFSPNLNLNENNNDKNSFIEMKSINYNEENNVKNDNKIDLEYSNLDYRQYWLYGNNYNDLKPSNIGNTKSYLFCNDSPLIIIGPDCK